MRGDGQNRGRHVRRVRRRPNPRVRRRPNPPSASAPKSAGYVGALFLLERDPQCGGGSDVQSAKSPRNWRRTGAGNRASERSTHSALPMLTRRSVRIIRGKGATCSTWDGTPGSAAAGPAPATGAGRRGRRRMRAERAPSAENCDCQDDPADPVRARRSFPSSPLSPTRSRSGRRDRRRPRPGTV